MAKGPLVTEAVEIMIGNVHRNHPKWKASEVRNEVRILLGEKNPGLPPSFPSLSTVQRVLAELRKRYREAPKDPLHEPWSMGTLDQYPLAPNTIPFVLKVWKLLEEKAYQLRYFRPPFDLPLSIREAKWVSRLCHVIPDDIERLSLTSTIYAEGEELSERLGHPIFDTTELDYDLMKPNRPLPSELIAIMEHIRSQVEQSHNVKQLDSLTNEEVAKQEGDSR